MSEEAKIWADAPLPLDPVSKAILSKLAGVSDVEDCAWMTVPDLAERVGVSVRTVQSRLRKLEGGNDDGAVYIRLTGRTHRYGTREVPIYELMVDHDMVAEIQDRRKGRKRAEAERRATVKPASRAVEEGRAMGATVCTHSGDAEDAICTRMGATVCTRNEENRGEGFTTFTLQGARGLREAARKVLDAWPSEHRALSSPREVAKALAGEVRQGQDIAAVIASTGPYVADRKAWGASGQPMAPHRFIASGRWETFAPTVVAVPTQQGSPGGETVSPDPKRLALRQRVVREFGEAAARSYFDPCALGADGVLQARTGAQLAWLSERGFKVQRAEAQG